LSPYGNTFVPLHSGLEYHSANRFSIKGLLHSLQKKGKLLHSLKLRIPPPSGISTT
jgi:hypothetical protein